MTPLDAAKILELPVDATPEQCEARFQELRRKLEDKIAKAPTPGLQAKYRDSLSEITTAFETLTLASDSSALPVLRKQEALSNKREASESGVAGVPPPREASTPSGFRSQVSGAPSAKPKSGGGKEFAIVAVIAVLVLAGGGWFVMKTRAENAQKERVAAEAKATAERQAEEKKLAEQQEKDRLVAEEKAERERQEKLITRLRSQMAELNVTYDALMRSEQIAERELSELKSQERDISRDQKGTPTPASRRLSAQLQTQDRLVSWMRDTLPAHPAKIARAKADELISARAADEATTSVAAYTAAIAQLKRDIATQRDNTTITGTVSLAANVPGVTWRLTDSFGVVTTGTTPAKASNIGAGTITVEFSYKTFPPQRYEVSLAPRGEAAVGAEFKESVLRLRSTTPNAVITPAGEASDGWQVYRLGPGRHRFQISAPGYVTNNRAVTLGTDEHKDLEVSLDNRPQALLFAEATALLPEIIGKGPDFIRILWLSAAAGLFDDETFAESLDQAFEQFEGEKWVPLHLSLASSDSRMFGWIKGESIELIPAPAGIDKAIALAFKQHTSSKPVHVQTDPYPDRTRSILRKTEMVQQAVDMVLVGKDPFTTGLQRDDIDDWKKLVSALIEQGRPDLSLVWMQQAPPEKNRPARMRTKSWMLDLITVGRVDEAIKLFESDNARWFTADPQITTFVSDYPAAQYNMTEMFRVARHRADREGLEKLAALVRRLMAGPVPPLSTIGLKGETWRNAWLESLLLSGLTTAENKLVEQVIAFADSTTSSVWGKPNPPRIPANTSREVINATTEVIDEYGRGLSDDGRLYRHLQSKILLANGKTEAAYAQVMKASVVYRDVLMLTLAYSHASLARWYDAVGTIDRSKKLKLALAIETNPNVTAFHLQSIENEYKNQRSRLPNIFGLAAAEHLNEKQAMADLRGIADPTERVYAIFTYLLRRRELDAMTSEQRDFIKNLPPL